ncbi:MAG TPA: M50 family metallopeptidase [Caulobacteraceae bacterium]|jgi:regulator of sigma E protease
MIDFFTSLWLWIVPFLLVLTVVVTLHELGHFTVARLFGVAIDRFSIGFGKTLFSRRDRKGVVWRVAALPLGGYVKFAGDDNAASVPDADDLADLRGRILAREGPKGLKRYFHFKPLWQRALVVIAGPAANFLTAIVIFAGFALAAGEVTVLLPRVGAVDPGSPAAQAGFKPGDLIQKANGATIGDFTDLSRFVMIRAGEPIRFQVDRAGQTVTIVATPQRKTITDPASGSAVTIGRLGLGPSISKTDLKTFRFTPLTALGEGVRQTDELVRMSLVYLRRIVTGRENGDQLSGPIGIAGASKSVTAAAAQGEAPLDVRLLRIGVAFLSLVAMISVAVGFANLLPIPVLDGGHLLFYAYEAVARRPLAAKVQEAGYRIGFAMLIGLVLFATWNDLQRYKVFQLIGGAFS